MIEQILVADRHLQVDQVAKARDIYERVVQLDPGNAIAVVGMARCALADGNDRQAHELAARALLIDPENDMARRMEARLSEILATRGEPVERPAAASTPGPLGMRSVVTQPKAAGTGGSPAPASARAALPAALPAAPSAIPATTLPATSAATPRKEPPVRKSLVDRLLGR